MTLIFRWSTATFIQSESVSPLMEQKHISCIPSLLEHLQPSAAKSWQQCGVDCMYRRNTSDNPYVINSNCFIITSTVPRFVNLRKAVI